MSDKNSIKSAKASDSTPDKKYRRWRDEVAKAEKELRDFHDSGQKVVKRFLDERDGVDRAVRKFNIFTTNVGILQSSLYANIPKVSITRRFDQFMDEPARVAAMLLQNAVMQDMEDSDCDFDQVMRDAVEDRLVPGIGQAWIRLSTEVEEKELEEIVDPMTGEIVQAAATYEQITEQEVELDHVHWADFLYSPCRTWTERRWVGRRVYMDYDALVTRFGKALADKIPLDYKPDNNPDASGNTPTNEVLQRAVIYEIWDRVEKRVIWLSKGHNELLDEKDDPLGLEDFDPCPRPLFALTSTSNCVPRADFVMLQDQYDEMDDVNNRISLLVAACKVVGVYDSGSDGLKKLLQEGVENTLVPADNWSMFAEKGGIKGQVDWLPLDMVIAALERLRQAREDIKAQIYELTGISDIVRGDTKASETLGAQKIKAQFASVRIQKLQDEVARFAQDILRIKAQIICKHFDPAIILQMSNAKFTPDMAVPELIQAGLALLKDEEGFNWRVKVQADSLGQQDYQMQKQEKVEFTNAMATFLQSAATTIKAMPPSAPMVFETLKFAISGFKGGQELESVIDNGIQAIMKDMEAQKEAAKNQPNPEQQKAQMEMQKMQAELGMEKERMQMEQQAKMQELGMKQEAHRMDMQFRAAENQQKLQQDQAKFEQSMVQAQQKAMQQLVADARKDSENAGS
jgi:hypothetical protein